MAPFVVVVAALLSIFLYQLRHPQYDWDMLPYMVIALMDEGQTLEAAHHNVYEAIRIGAPSETYDKLTDKFPIDNADRTYRAEAAHDPRNFAESLPFYVVKPIFPALIAGLHLTGVNLLRAPAILLE